MIVELINTGNELMLGRVLNIHQQWICRQLADAGYVVSRQVTVADTGAEIQQAVRESLCRADLVITTGGLGPTSDDLTRDAIAGMLGLQLREDSSVLKRIESYFALLNRPMPDLTRVQALIPEGALVLPNPNGTAPGLAIKIEVGKFRTAARPGWLIMLPGPPRELRPMFTETVLPLIRRELPADEAFVCRTLRTSGVGESRAQERIEKPMQQLVERGLELGYCARPGQVDVRIAAHGDAARELVEAGMAVLQQELGPYIYAEEDAAIEETIVRLLRQRGETLALAESCTGGRLADRITNVPGASEAFRGGFVAYSNAMKQECVAVSAQALSRNGAVSEAVARELAEGARRLAGSDYALATTGIAGPGGGIPEKPVGTVFIALATKASVQVVRMFNPWDRQTFKDVTAQQALSLLRNQLIAAQPG